MFNSGNFFGVGGFGDDSTGTKCSVSTDVPCRRFNNRRSWAVSFLDNSTRLIMVCDNNFCAWLQCAEWSRPVSFIEINLLLQSAVLFSLTQSRHIWKLWI